LNDLPVNLFDAAVYICLFVAVVSGFRTGLLRGLATIFGYLAAAPVAVVAAPYLTPFLIEQFKVPPAQNGLVFAGLFLVIGFVLGVLLRLAVSEIVGADINLPDRAAGAMLGAVRVILLAVLMVVVFDRIIPAGREPAFLAGSKLRPILSEAGQAGLKTLPSDIADTIDKIKKQQRL
jgi:membrane protein required for colicin V production